MTIDQDIMKRLKERQRKLELIEKNLSKIHHCDKCHDKTVGISVDIMGNTYCGYCGQRVDYFKTLEDEDDKS